MEISKKNIRIWSMLGMRRMIGLLLSEVADNDKNFLFVTADLGRYFGIEELAKRHSDRIIDLGICEQNMIGVSAGLQSEGFDVWAATYGTFISARALDQVRVNVGLMNFGIKLIGGAGGLCDGNFSATHMALEDVSYMRSIPNMTIICPADGLELVKAVEALSRCWGPAYIRLTGRADTPIVHINDYVFEMGKAERITEKKREIVFISSGVILGNVLKASELLKIEGLDTEVINMHTISPVDTEILDELRNRKIIFVVEEHMKTGGLGSAIKDYYAEGDRHPPVISIAVDNYYPKAQEYNDLLDVVGLSVDGIADKVRETIKRY